LAWNRDRRSLFEDTTFLSYFLPLVHAMEGYIAVKKWVFQKGALVVIGKIPNP